jgi:hypothetical protein
LIGGIALVAVLSIFLPMGSGLARLQVDNISFVNATEALVFLAGFEVLMVAIVSVTAYSVAKWRRATRRA